MVDGFGSIGLRHWQARLARRHREVWLAKLVEQLRCNELVAEAESPVAVVADSGSPAWVDLTRYP